MLEKPDRFWTQDISDRFGRSEDQRDFEDDKLKSRHFLKGEKIRHLYIKTFGTKLYGEQTSLLF